MFKAMVKRIVGENHWGFLMWSRHCFGLFLATRFYLINVVTGKTDIFCISWKGMEFFLRPGTSDENVFSEIFVSKEYDIDLGAPLFILDAGANTGLSAMFFAKKYPTATIVAVEPEPSNFKLLLMNTRAFPNIKPMRAGVWSKKTYLRIKDSNVGPWAFQVLESESETDIPAIGINDIISEFNMPIIDVLKMDIEGSELEVLSNNNYWINKVRTLIIELHDRFRPGCTEALDALLQGRTYQRSQSGESIVISNLSKP